MKKNRAVLLIAGVAALLAAGDVARAQAGKPAPGFPSTSTRYGLGVCVLDPTSPISGNHASTVQEYVLCFSLGTFEGEAGLELARQTAEKAVRDGVHDASSITRPAWYPAHRILKVEMRTFQQ